MSTIREGLGFLSSSRKDYGFYSTNPRLLRIAYNLERLCWCLHLPDSNKYKNPPRPIITRLMSVWVRPDDYIIFDPDCYGITLTIGPGQDCKISLFGREVGFLCYPPGTPRCLLIWDLNTRERYVSCEQAGVLAGYISHLADDARYLYAQYSGSTPRKTYLRFNYD